MTAEERIRADALTECATVLVRRSDLLEVLSTLDALRRSYEERGQAIAEIRPTCETCQHKQPAVNRADGPWCGYLSDMTDEGGGRILCCDMGSTVTDTDGGCYAHTPKAVTS